mmetsp:Transcript_97961/g.169670  ORF Transcript_97961/g.169670 Transcript_97961/m.169670 type:complete len:306 (-) Transcript_97961:222-1139(-)
MTAGDGYDPTAPKGGSLSQLFCGNCCRKDTKTGEIELPNDAPIQYAKAENVSLTGLEPPAASRDKSKDEISRAGGVDTRLPPKAQDASATSGEQVEQEDSEYYEDSEEEEEEEEETEEEPENPGPPQSQQKSIDELRKSWGNLKKQLDSNPSPKWIGTRQHNMTQVIEEESDEDDDDDCLPSSPEARKQEIAKLKASFSDLAEKLDNQGSLGSAGSESNKMHGSATYNPPARQSDEHLQTGRGAETAAGLADADGAQPKEPGRASAQGTDWEKIQNHSSMEAHTGSIPVSANSHAKRKKGKCTVM